MKDKGPITIVTITLPNEPNVIYAFLSLLFPRLYMDVYTFLFTNYFPKTVPYYCHMLSGTLTAIFIFFQVHL